MKATSWPATQGRQESRKRGRGPTIPASSPQEIHRENHRECHPELARTYANARSTVPAPPMELDAPQQTRHRPKQRQHRALITTRPPCREASRNRQAQLPQLPPCEDRPATPDRKSHHPHQSSSSRPLHSKSTLACHYELCRSPERTAP